MSARLHKSQVRRCSPKNYTRTKKPQKILCWYSIAIMVVALSGQPNRLAAMVLKRCTIWLVAFKCGRLKSIPMFLLPSQSAEPRK